MTKFHPRESSKRRFSAQVPSLRGLPTEITRKGLPRCGQKRMVAACVLFQLYQKCVAVAYQELLPPTGYLNLPHKRDVTLFHRITRVHSKATFSRITCRGVSIVVSQEGAVEAVLRLCKTDHLILRGYCSAILKQFAATPILREKLVARGGVRKMRTNVRTLPPVLCSSAEQMFHRREPHHMRVVVFLFENRWHGRELGACFWISSP